MTPEQSSFEAYLNSLFDRAADLGDSINMENFRIVVWARPSGIKYDITCGPYNNETEVKGTDLESIMEELIRRRGFDIAQFTNLLAKE